jgi:diguanylate cyclase (GGDEF)-like protein
LLSYKGIAISAHILKHSYRPSQVFNRTCLLICGILLSSFSGFAEVKFDIEKANTIAHFRAIPIYLSGDNLQPFTRHLQQDPKGYLWSSGSSGILRYDGYENTIFDFANSEYLAEAGDAYMLLDSKGKLWAAKSNLHLFDQTTNTFKAFNLANQGRITSMTEDAEGHLWISGFQFGFIQFDPETKKVIKRVSADVYPDAPENVQSIQFDKSQNIIWMVSEKGVFGYDLDEESLFQVETDIDSFFSIFFIRDIAIDAKRNALWIGTPKGALRINTKSRSAQRYTADGYPGSLPVSDVSVTFLDSAGIVWLGLEKEGLCTFKHSTEKFICLRSSIKGAYKLPYATVEDISEDSNGSLWLSMNQYGLYRISPDLEKFVTLRSQITNNAEGYFPNSFDGIVRENNDIWIATDGGGINVFNYKSGIFSSIKNDPQDINTLSSNSVISLTEDEYGYIWAGTWAGGISKINPQTLLSTQYLNLPNAPVDETLAGDNVFVVVSDKKGGIWISVWGRGLQYLNVEENRFINFLHKSRGGSSNIRSKEISHIQLYQNQVWLTGDGGLEVIDIETGKLRTVLAADKHQFTYVWVESLEEVWIGTALGLIRLNTVTGEKNLFKDIEALSNSEVSYVKKDKENKVWIATRNGLLVFDEISGEVTRYSEQEGMAGNRMSSHGAFIEVDDSLYVPSTYGVTIVNPSDMPKNSYRPTTIITHVEFLNTETHSIESSDNQFSLTGSEKIEIPISANSLSFEFTALSFIFPESNKFRYRLVGWQNDFIETSANERFARFTNLPAGDYIFEVYGGNSSLYYDENGDSFSFTILPAWWTRWWANLLFAMACMLCVLFVYKWRFSLTIKREKELKQKVAEKTTQLQSYASELKATSDSLFSLNTELEDRVAQRTKELQLEVNERKAAESKLFHMAFHDSLTDLPNREWIIQLIEKLLIRCQQEANFSFGIMFLDGDRFKQINDTLGHILGDQLLDAAAKRLLSLAQGNQHIGRLGGDEFTVIAESHDESELSSLAQQIIDEFKKPFTLENHVVYFNVSIGIVKCDARYDAVPEVLRSADIAMYRAKALGRSTYQLFDEDMQKNMLEIAALEASLRIAVEENQFFLVYQPVVDLKSGSIDGFEALIRWQHPEKGIISPFTFIPIAEETGLIWDIGKWVMREACSQAKQWHDMGLGFKPCMSVNLSTNQLRNSLFLEVVDEIIASTGIDSKYLKLELTESVLIENNHALGLLYEALRKRNIDLAIDDFGTGYSSLAYLSEIPVQFLKIDRCFVEVIDKNKDAEIYQDALEIVKATISLGKSLRKQIVAEGIETETQLNALIEHGCDFAQGYFLSKPLSVDLATELLRSNYHLSHVKVDTKNEG